MSLKNYEKAAAMVDARRETESRNHQLSESGNIDRNRRIASVEKQLNAGISPEAAFVPPTTLPQR